MCSWFFSTCCCEEQSRGTELPAGIEQVSLFPDKCVSYDPEGGGRVTYASEIDGRWEHLCDVVEHSGGVRFRVPFDDSRRRSLRELDLLLEDGWHFVFGGDACTKGPGTLRVLETMVKLKKKCPTRVHLLLGENDMNRTSWIEGFESDFEVRRQELGLLGAVSPDEVTDTEVMKSYEDSLKPGGWSWEYLQLAQLGILLGETLFMYGEILSGGVTMEDVRSSPKHQTALRLGMVPDDAEKSENVQEWLKVLNSWAKQKIATWDLSLTWDPLDEKQVMS